MKSSNTRTWLGGPTCAWTPTVIETTGDRTEFRDRTRPVEMRETPPRRQHPGPDRTQRVPSPGTLPGRARFHPAHHHRPPRTCYLINGLRAPAEHANTHPSGPPSPPFRRVTVCPGESALAHLPSGEFTANTAWLVLAVIVFNLTRAART